MTNKIGSLILL